MALTERLFVVVIFSNTKGAMIMSFSEFEKIWYEFLHFLDRVMGWLNYVVGGADDPYGYDGFWENLFPTRN